MHVHTENDERPNLWEHQQHAILSSVPNLRIAVWNSFLLLLDGREKSVALVGGAFPRGAVRTIVKRIFSMT